MEEMKIQKKILDFLGHWPDDNSTKFAKFRALISLVIGYVFVATLLVEITKHLQEYDVLSELLGVAASVGYTHVKLIIFRKNFKPLARMIRMLNVEIFNNYPKAFDNIMKRHIKRTTILGTLYQFSCFFTVGLYCITPLLSKLDLPLTFTYNVGQFKPAIYILQVLGLSNAVANNCCIDIMAIGLMGRTAAQIAILNEKITSFKNVEPNKPENKTTAYMQNLKNCIIHHNTIIKFVEVMEEALSGICLAQYLESMTAICNIGFQLVIIQPGSIQFNSVVMYFFSMMCQLGIYCWHGNEIILNSLETKDACYKSQWTDCDVRVRKMLIIITERSRRPLHVTAAKFSIVCLSSFTSVINTSYSYFALMQRLYANTQK